VLTAHLDTPVVAEAAVEATALHAFEILPQGRVEKIGILLACLPVLRITILIEHERRDLELKRVADDRDDLVDLIGGELARALVHVDVALLADDI